MNGTTALKRLCDLSGTWLLLIILCLGSLPVSAEQWVSDLGDGRYKNPVLFADYSDPGQIRLYAVRNMTQNGNLRFVPNLLLQKFPSPAFSATTKVTFHPDKEGDKSGLVVMGQAWGYLAFYQGDAGVRLGMFTGHYEQYDDVTVEVASIPAVATGDRQFTYFLKVNVEEGGLCQFSYSLDGLQFEVLGEKFQAKQGVWIGAKVGLFSLSPKINASNGFSDFDWFRLK